MGVPIDAMVTFEVDSQLDSELELFRIDDLLLGVPGPTVSGSDDFQRGPCTLHMTGSQPGDGDAT